VDPEWDAMQMKYLHGCCICSHRVLCHHMVPREIFLLIVGNWYMLPDRCHLNSQILLQTRTEHEVRFVSTFRRDASNKWKVGLVFSGEKGISWQPFRAIVSYGLLKVSLMLFPFVIHFVTVMLEEMQSSLSREHNLCKGFLIHLESIG